MKTCKKLFCMVLSILVVLGMMSGCRKKAEPTEPTTVPTTEPTTAPIIYSITYMPNGGVMPWDTDMDFTLEDPAELVEPEKENYEFIGWYEEEDFSGYLYTDTVGETGDKVYYAKWAPKEYTITYNLGGGKMPEGETNPSSYTIESEEIVLKAPTRSGYTFVGWVDENFIEVENVNGGTGEGSKTQDEIIIPAGSTGNKAYTAIWEVETSSGNGAGRPAGNGHTHSYKTVKKVKASCYTEEYILKRCSCGHQYRDVKAPKLEHEWLDWILVKEETLEENGIVKRSCDICRVVESKFVDEIPDLEPEETK